MQAMKIMTALSCTTSDNEQICSRYSNKTVTILIKQSEVYIHLRTEHILSN